MRKYIVQHARDGQATVMEVEIELISAMEDASVLWLPEGEYRARVLAPKSLYEKQMDGSLTPPVWYSHAFYWNAIQAQLVAEKNVRSAFERDLRKMGGAYTEQQVQEKLSEIKVINLK